MHKCCVTLILALVVVFSFSSCSEEDPCVDLSLVNHIDCFCPAYVDPVCGCNGETYNNSCEASCDGVLSWVEGACNN